MPTAQDRSNSYKTPATPVADTFTIMAPAPNIKRATIDRPKAAAVLCLETEGPNRNTKLLQAPKASPHTKVNRCPKREHAAVANPPQKTMGM
mmetsp:Transcript_136912/g.241400  ORF Transcript_136912/g.241400 Transcript_136912/m.241400 type:complete len:92 (+) Transcript_136912:62-337(+)